MCCLMICFLEDFDFFYSDAGGILDAVAILAQAVLLERASDFHEPIAQSSPVHACVLDCHVIHATLRNTVIARIEVILLLEDLECATGAPLRRDLWAEEGE